MEIKGIPAKLQNHTFYLEEEIRISRRIEEMAESAFAGDPRGPEILEAIRKLRKSMKLRRDILEDLDGALRDQEVVLEEYVRELWRQNY